jgi:two-component system, OmpR family, sensor histidine kinase CiaH
MPASIQIRKVTTIFAIYWITLIYVLAAQVWWFVALNRMNDQMTALKLEQVSPKDPEQAKKHEALISEQKRKRAQYIGEGITFLLLILTGAVSAFQAIRRQFKLSQQQQNFMMAIAHELKTPIAVTILNLDTLHKRKLPEDIQHKMISSTLEEANRLNGLCSNLLLTGQLEAGKYQLSAEEVNLSELLEETIHQYAARFDKLQLHTHVQEELVFNGDRILLQMAFSNLIDNAIKYSPKDKAIDVELGEEGKEIVLKVKDQGKGIPESEKSLVFKKFYRGGNENAKVVKGTGLGLYLTKEIVSYHGGTISVYDNTPMGIIFEVRFKESA